MTFKPIFFANGNNRSLASIFLVFAGTANNPCDRFFLFQIQCINHRIPATSYDCKNDKKKAPAIPEDAFEFKTVYL